MRGKGPVGTDFARGWWDPTLRHDAPPNRCVRQAVVDEREMFAERRNLSRPPTGGMARKNPTNLARVLSVEKKAENPTSCPARPTAESREKCEVSLQLPSVAACLTPETCCATQDQAAMAVIEETIASHMLFMPALYLTVQSARAPFTHLTLHAWPTPTRLTPLC